MAASSPSATASGGIIVAEARRQRVPRAFALAVAWQESGWQAGVVSSAGAIGVMQLLPATADWVVGHHARPPGEPLGRVQNVRAGVRLLRHYLDRYGGNRSLALAAYYQGQAGGRSARRLRGLAPVHRLDPVRCRRCSGAEASAHQASIASDPHSRHRPSQPARR